jgi:nuclear pore complex protein Nup155
MASAFASSRLPGNISGPSNTTVKHGQQPVDLHALQNASRILHDQFAKDAQIIPDLGEMLAASTKKTLSTFSSCPDILLAGGQASTSYSVFPDDIRVPYQKKKFVGIPEGLFQYYDSQLFSHPVAWQLNPHDVF